MFTAIWLSDVKKKVSRTLVMWKKGIMGKRKKSETKGKVH